MQAFSNDVNLFFPGFYPVIMKNYLSAISYLLTVIVALLIIQSFSPVDNNISSPAKNFNDDWEFALSPDSAAIFSSEGKAIWQLVKLPHTPVIEPLVIVNQWQGICWYRKKFRVDNGLRGKQLFIKFEGAMNVAEVWVNGVKKITHLGGYLPFVIDFTAEAEIGSENTILVRLDNNDNPITGPKPLKTLDFNMYGGLYRDVFFIEENPLYITDPISADKVGGGGIFVTYPVVSKEKAVVKVQTNVKNAAKKEINFEVQHELWKNKKKIISHISQKQSLTSGSDKDVIAEITLGYPELWSPSDPNLYKLVTKVVSDKKITDIDTTQIGIRNFEVTKEYLAINGEKVHLLGVNRHQEYPFIGYALSNEAQYRDAKKIKDAGFDCIRLSHYPHSPSFMDACDELGLVVIDAIPGWQYFNKSEAFQSQVLRTCRDMIRRDRNHACVLAWEVSLNETNMPQDFIDRATLIAHEEYPGNQCFAAGWQNYGYDIYIQARQSRLNRYKKPDKPYIVSEYGDWEYYAMNAGLNQHEWQGLLKEERSSRQLLSAGETRLLQQVTNIQEAHNDNFTTPAFADCYWVMYDYNRGYAIDLEASGIMSVTRLPKFSYYFFQSQRDANNVSELNQSGPMVYIASYWNEKSNPDIHVFSNCEEVELLLNGVILGRQKPDTNRISKHLAHPPFTFNLKEFKPGTIIARGFIKGQNVTEHSVATPDNPAGILLSYDESGKPPKANSNDVIFVFARIVDKNGTVSPINGQKVEFILSGDAELINPGEIVSEAGIATALVRIGRKSSPLKVKATAGNIKAGEIIIPITK
jgi:beta-galactosidase